MAKPEIVTGVSETRNSGIRRKTDPVTATIAEAIDNHASIVSPTMLNILGAVFVIGSAIATAKGRDRLACELHTTGSLMDSIDGPLARVKDARNPGSVDFKAGQLYDALSDRTQETSAALGRAVRAYQKGDRVGEALAFATALTSPWTSLSRAYAEIKGISVPESGKGLLGKVGTRVGKAAASIVATTFHEIKGVPVQSPIDALITASNLKTTFDRVQDARNNEPTLSMETSKDAKNRLAALGAFAAVSLAATAFTFWKLHKPTRQE